jgi:peptide methionine sulfoxide reductase msrA/msrB
VDKSASLTDFELSIIQRKGTEPAFSGRFTDALQPGTYICRQCGLALFRASQKFHSGCGWPSFEDELPDAIGYCADQDGIRTEIICNRCQAHLGHVFYGEKLTSKNKRHCVNSVSIEFIQNLEILDTEEAILAGGCFWGVEYYFQKLKGILLTEVGYCGGHQVNPSYEEVCSHLTEHVEAIRVIYDPKVIPFEKVIEFFFRNS